MKLKEQQFLLALWLWAIQFSFFQDSERSLFLSKA